MKDKIPTTTVFFQDACLHHRYIRSRDLAAIVERPERLRAVGIGVAAAIARLQEAATSLSTPLADQGEAAETAQPVQVDADTLAVAIGKMKLDREGNPPVDFVSVVHSKATVDLLSHPAVKYVHGDIEGDVYIESLLRLARESRDKIEEGGSEIPSHLSQGDLYLCPESISAIQGALGAVCEAVDNVILSSPQKEGLGTSSFDLLASRAFVSIRPPGHHCGEDTPSGFCFVNNVAVGAAHAHLKHGINRVVIFDIDLHHGNGTQSIVWQINEEAYRQTLESDVGGSSPTKPSLRAYYGSVHDVLSYPCEDGKLEFVQAASVSIHKAHGQYIENVHMAPYPTEEYFWEVLYKKQYGRMLCKARDFLDDTGGPGDDVLVFISCGMDASEHEYASMSRHGRKVPASLYYHFTRDVGMLANRYARGRIVSVLEGGYSDRALISGAMAHICGLVAAGNDQIADHVKWEWWDGEILTKLEKLGKKRRGGRSSLACGSPEPYLKRALDIFQSFDLSANTVNKAKSPPPRTMTLRTRKEKDLAPSVLEQSYANIIDGKGKIDSVTQSSPEPPAGLQLSFDNDTKEGDPETGITSAGKIAGSSGDGKKLPRVILKLGQDPRSHSNSL